MPRTGCTPSSERQNLALERGLSDHGQQGRGARQHGDKGRGLRLKSEMALAADWLRAQRAIFFGVFGFGEP